MRPLRGREIPRALRATRFGLWGLAGIFGCLTVLQLVSIGAVFARGSRADAASAAKKTSGAQGEASAPAVSDFAVIWERMDPPHPEPKAGPAAAPKPMPPPDMYPSMRLLGTIMDEGGGCALLQIKPGVTQMIRQGESVGDIQVLEVKDNQAVVQVPNYTKTLKLEAKASGH